MTEGRALQTVTFIILDTHDSNQKTVKNSEGIKMNGCKQTMHMDVAGLSASISHNLADGIHPPVSWGVEHFVEPEHTTKTRDIINSENHQDEAFQNLNIWQCKIKT